MASSSVKLTNIRIGDFVLRLDCLSVEQKAAQAHLAQVRDASHNRKVKRTDLIAAVLRTTPQTTLQELMKLLTGNSAEVHREQSHRPLYTNPKMFTHTELIGPARIRSGGR